MLPITQKIIDAGRQIEKEISNPESGYMMFNSGGVEVEVGEFLYSLTHLLKPKSILETGTHLGISSSYFAKALEELGRGKITTLEVIPELRDDAVKLWQALNLGPQIDSHLQASQSFMPTTDTIDLLFLDSEPQYRFDEFIRFWPWVPIGGLIIIHDMNNKLGRSGIEAHGMVDWPYGDFREKLGPFIKRYDVQVFSFATPRGLTIFQKTSNEFEATRFLQTTCANSDFGFDNYKRLIEKLSIVIDLIHKKVKE
jgi:predicted O-methyltransferase YrrM